MARITIATPELSDAATLTAGSAVASLPVSNLQTRQPGERWRATDLANVYLEIDLGSAAAINLVALLNTNASSAATWQVRAAATQGALTTSPGYDSGSVSMWPVAGLDGLPWTHARLWLSTSQTYRWWRIDVSDSGNADGHFQAGRLYVASAWEAPRNVQYGWSVTWNDPSVKRRSTGSQLYSLVRTPWRSFDGALSFLSEGQMYDNLYDLQRRRGASRDVLLMRDPEATDHFMAQSVYGVLETLQPLVQERLAVFRSRLIVEELLP